MKKLFPAASLVMAALAFTACSEKKFHVEGSIENAKDSLLYFENISLEGPVVVDSVRLDADGKFDFSDKCPEAPEFYRLRIAGQIINISVHTTKTEYVNAKITHKGAHYKESGTTE